ncbi:unnamed protein product [Linum tenue]|uniref:Uncharacterized protein n=1 Tax=Linum tenue TaxID=586396 RepID=A0AAV0RVH6_9ROSI|nr:unnamed protein product [Linum tenue]
METTSTGRTQWRPRSQEPEPEPEQRWEESKALVLLSPDFGTAWNSRKLIISKKTQASMFTDELRLSALVLSYSPKSEQAWSHRRWVIKNMAKNRTTLQEILREEYDLVEKIAEVIQEQKQSKTWVGLHVADHSCFHYRMRLIFRILEDCCRKQEEGSCDSCVEVYLIWQEELDWNEELIKRYLGREQIPETQKLELREKIENESLDAMLKLVSLRGPPFGAI